MISEYHQTLINYKLGNNNKKIFKFLKTEKLYFNNHQKTISSEIRPRPIALRGEVIGGAQYARRHKNGPK